ncbi:MAG: Mo-dependent nitrogenase C-terminal domain-containing protein [Cyanobacteria bacterium P01_D01_bin.71]
MPSTIESPYTPEQITVWFRGLLTIAWADGHFDEEEKSLITSMTQEEFAPNINFFDALKPISAEDLAAGLGQQTDVAEDFLRTAVMVALADGIYSIEEDQKLHRFCTALGLEDQVLESVRATLCGVEKTAPIPPDISESQGLEPLKPAREWLDQLDVKDPRLARFICKMVPSQCPFERDVTLFKKKIIHIPAMCKLNPLYEQLVGLRFRALSYLADNCGEDVTPYL